MSAIVVAVMADCVSRKSSLQPNQRESTVKLQLPHRVSFFGGFGARDRSHLLLELLGTSGRHRLPDGRTRRRRRRRRAVRRRVGLRRRRRRPVDGVGADEQRHGSPLLHAVGHTTATGDRVVEHRQLSQLSRLLHAVR